MCKTLQSLVQSLDTESISVGVIIAEDESRVSRHLRVCASERKIPMMVSTCNNHFGIKLIIYTLKCTTYKKKTFICT